MTRLAIKSAESGTIYSINLDSVNFYEVRDFDSESSQCAIDFWFDNRKAKFLCNKGESKSFIHAEIKMCVANGEILEVAKEF